MNVALDIVAGWIALDVVLVLGWHLAHVRNRYVGNLVLTSARLR
jgi:hypothetical protein